MFGYSLPLLFGRHLYSPRLLRPCETLKRQTFFAGMFNDTLQDSGMRAAVIDLALKSFR